MLSPRYMCLITQNLGLAVSESKSKKETKKERKKERKKEHLSTCLFSFFDYFRSEVKLFYNSIFLQSCASAWGRSYKLNSLLVFNEDLLIIVCMVVGATNSPICTKYIKQFDRFTLVLIC